MTRGEVGCALTHYKMWLIALERGYDKVTFLEDDASPVEGWEDTFNTLTSDIEWDVVHLHSHRKPDERTAQRVKVKRGLYTGYKEGGGSLGYVLNKNAMEWLISNILPIQHPVDGYTNRLSAPWANSGLKCFITIPYLILEDGTTVSIIGGNRDKVPTS